MILPKKRSLIVIAVVILVIAIILSSFVYLNSQEYAGKVESIRIATGGEAASLIYIAQNQQYFASNGLNVTIKNYPSGLENIETMLKSDVDIATAAEFVFTNQLLANKSICTFASIDTFSNEYVVGRTDKGINSPADLKGKTVGVPLGTAAEFYLGRFLEFNGIDLSQVTLVNVPPQQTPNVLANGTVDAVIAWQPNINTIESQLSNKTVIWPAQNNQLTYLNTICTTDWAAAHPKIITRFLNSLAQAEYYIITNPGSAKNILQNTFNYTDAYIESVWSEHYFSLSLDQTLILAMQDEASWLINNKLTNATVLPNFLNYVYLDGLEAVKPQSVTVIK